MDATNETAHPVDDKPRWRPLRKHRRWLPEQQHLRGAVFPSRVELYRIRWGKRRISGRALIIVELIRVGAPAKVVCSTVRFPETRQRAAGQSAGGGGGGGGFRPIDATEEES